MIATLDDAGTACLVLRACSCCCAAMTVLACSMMMGCDAIERDLQR
jgi:hypothetical protein